MNSEIYLITGLLIIFCIAVSVIAYYLMPKLNTITKALIGSFLIPYLCIVFIFIGLLNTSLIKKIGNKGVTSFFTFLKECFINYYMNTGLFIATIIIFTVWYYRQRKKR